MARAKKPSSPERPETQAEAVSRLTDTLQSVEQELRVLRDVLDEIRDAFEWALKNDRFRNPPHVVHVTRMSKLGVPLDRPTPQSGRAPAPPQSQLASTHAPQKPSQSSLFGSEE